MSPFDAARYARLLEGLSVAEVCLSGLEFSGRLDAEYYQPEYLRAEGLIAARSAVPLSSVADFLIGPFGSAFTVENYCDDHTYRYIRGKDVKPMSIVEDDNVYMPKADYDRLAKYALKDGDVLVSVVGTIGNSALVEPQHVPAIFSCKSTAVRTRAVDPRYLIAFLNCRYGRSLLIRKERGAVQKGLNLDDLKTLSLFLAGGDLQQRIAEIYALAGQAKVASKAALEAAESHLLNALLLQSWQPPEPLSYVRRSSEAFASGRLDAEFFSPRTNAIRAILREKGDVPLSDIGLVSTGHPWRSDRFIDRGSSEGVPFVRIRDCKPGAIDGEDLDRLPEAYAKQEAQPMAQSGDLVIGMDGLRWFYASSLLSPCYVNQRVGWLHGFEESFPGAYLVVVLNSLIGQSQLLSQMTIAQTVGHITLDDLRGLRVPTLQRSQRALIASKFMDSVVAKRRAAQLLDTTKRAVEIAIEDSEAAALAFLDRAAPRAH